MHEAGSEDVEERFPASAILQPNFDLSTQPPTTTLDDLASCVVSLATRTPEYMVDEEQGKRSHRKNPHSYASARGLSRRRKSASQTIQGLRCGVAFQVSCGEVSSNQKGSSVHRNRGSKNQLIFQGIMKTQRGVTVQNEPKICFQLTSFVMVLFFTIFLGKDGAVPGEPRHSVCQVLGCSLHSVRL